MPTSPDSSPPACLNAEAWGGTVICDGRTAERVKGSDDVPALRAAQGDADRAQF